MWRDGLDAVEDGAWSDQGGGLVAVTFALTNWNVPRGDPAALQGGGVRSDRLGVERARCELPRAPNCLTRLSIRPLTQRH